MADNTSAANAPSPYRGLILDFAGVLTVGVRQAQEQWCGAYGLAPDAWRTTLEGHPEAREYYRALEVGEMSQTAFNHHVAVLLGLADGEDLMGRVWSEGQPTSAMIALARSARAAGYTVALLSNSFGLDPYDPYERIGVRGLFDVTVLSELEGIVKPDPAIYRLTLERMGLTAGECVFVDDHPANLPPAEALGIHMVLATGVTGRPVWVCGGFQGPSWEVAALISLRVMFSVPVWMAVRAAVEMTWARALK